MMRGKFLGSKDHGEDAYRKKHLIEFDDGSFSVAYSPNDIEFKVGEAIDNEQGYWKSEEFGTFQLEAIRKMTFSDASAEFEK